MNLLRMAPGRKPLVAVRFPVSVTRFGNGSEGCKPESVLVFNRQRGSGG